MTVQPARPPSREARSWTCAVAVTCATFGPVAMANDRDKVIDLVNAVRLKGCPTAPAARTTLESDRALDDVAARVRRGSSLAVATAAESYPAQRSASIAVQSAKSPGALEHLLASEQYCRLVTDSAFVRIGVSGRGYESTIVLAAPFVAPSGADSVAHARRALQLVNAARAQRRACGGRRYAVAPPLTRDATLDAMAAAHAQDMAWHGRMTHQGSDGSAPAERATRAGYPWKFVAENVAAGQTTADEVVATWLASPGHCANIMNADLREMGIAYSFNASSPDGTYWVQTFGTRR